jgi:hypothetical protein
MNALSAWAGLISITLFAPAVQAACERGAYTSERGDFVVIGPLPNSQSPGERYLFRDGRRGSTAEANAPLTCADDAVTIRTSDGTVDRALGLDSYALALINRMSAATSRLLLSGFTEGYKELAQVRRELAKTSWSQQIHGEYSGEMLRLTDEELRRIGRARFDNLEIIWNYDAVAALERVSIPILWILAGADREAPIETSRAALLGLMKAGKPIEVYLFPNTDHGMVEFVTNADGSRTVTRITDGYLRLLGDWIQGRACGTYGRAQKLDARAHRAESVAPTCLGASR